MPTQVDHVMPRSRGGSDDRENLAPACKGCNMEKGDFTPEEYRAYREEKGLGWPPPSKFDIIKGVIEEMKVKFGYTDEDMHRMARRYAEQVFGERLSSS